MKILKKNLLGFAYALPAMLLIAGCGNSADPVFETNEPVELQITPTVALTRGVITNGTQNGASGHITEIAVYATGTGTDYGTGNNYAKYSYSSGSWGNSDANNKIYLTNAVATLYAYHPASATLTSNTIPVTIKETSTIATASNSSSTTTIAAASDETDYLYATSKAASNTAASVELTMNHALSMVSFRVYKENYKGAGKLTKIVLKNVAGKTALTKGTSNAMNITTGAITQTSAAAATYTRTITGYTLGTAKEANKLSILVLPIKTAIPTDEIEAEFTIDGADYTVSLKDPTETSTDGWLAGNNNLYSVKLSGTELSISKVEVTEWAEKVGGNLDIK